MRVNKVRRLAQQTRNDGYLSKRDYQEIVQEDSLRFKLHSKSLSFAVHITSDENTGVVGFGGFIFPYHGDHLILTLDYFLDDAPTSLTKTFNLIDNWNRFGLCMCIPEQTEGRLVVKIELEISDSIDIWGFSAGPITLLDKIKESIDNIHELNANHLSPETYYLSHTKNFEFPFSQTKGILAIENGQLILLKKCSFCQRMLPLRDDIQGALSFHKHTAKISKHQNECRSCKKWRINDEFNPIRTTDQLHESSLITREKKILLRESE
ncbi:TPA: hypothetical protein PXQ71_004172, partial [Yersinia enterocolitica]|nr:hypothetical protein [Yersinia enterocolitica]